MASLAFEPVHYESIRLQQNGNPRLHISPAAVAAEDGVAEMGIYHNSRAASSLSAAPERAMNHNPEKALDVLIAEGLGLGGEGKVVWTIGEDGGQSAPRP